MGKRVDQSARSVISPDPNIDVDEVGVPLAIAQTLTIAERVTSYNVHRMRECVLVGANSPGGAESVTLRDGHPPAPLAAPPSPRRRLRRRQADPARVHCRPRHPGGGPGLHRAALHPGRRQRRLQPAAVFAQGASAPFSPAPRSLWGGLQMGMMAHRVRVMSEGDTFRLNLSCTTPYNADFDGDEMNMHVPQSLAVRPPPSPPPPRRPALTGPRPRPPGRPSPRPRS